MRMALSSCDLFTIFNISAATRGRMLPDGICIVYYRNERAFRISWPSTRLFLFIQTRLRNQCSNWMLLMLLRHFHEVIVCGKHGNLLCKDLCNQVHHSPHRGHQKYSNRELLRLFIVNFIQNHICIYLLTLEVNPP
jgi:hypothetical protein